MEVVLTLNGFTKTMHIPEARPSVRVRIYKPIPVPRYIPNDAPVEQIDYMDVNFNHDYENVYQADLYDITEKQQLDKIRDKTINKLLGRIGGLEREIRRLKRG